MATEGLMSPNPFWGGCDALLCSPHQRSLWNYTVRFVLSEEPFSTLPQTEGEHKEDVPSAESEEEVPEWFSYEWRDGAGEADEAGDVDEEEFDFSTTTTSNSQIESCGSGTDDENDEQTTQVPSSSQVEDDDSDTWETRVERLQLQRDKYLEDQRRYSPRSTTVAVKAARRQTTVTTLASTPAHREPTATPTKLSSPTKKERRPKNVCRNWASRGTCLAARCTWEHPEQWKGQQDEGVYTSGSATVTKSVVAVGEKSQKSPKKKKGGKKSRK